jgi:hypothetical protein
MNNIAIITRKVKERGNSSDTDHNDFQNAKDKIYGSQKMN